MQLLIHPCLSVILIQVLMGLFYTIPCTNFDSLSFPLQTTELPRLLTVAEGFSWHFLDSASYEKTANWFLDNCDARCVLAERTARNAQALG